MPELSDHERPTRLDPADRFRVIEILQRHYSPENILLTEPTPVEIFRERTQRVERWEVVMWNVKTGEYVAWRREGGLKARGVVPDADGLVSGVQIHINGQPPPSVAPARQPQRPAGEIDGDDEEVDDTLIQSLAEQYMQEIQRKLTDPAPRIARKPGRLGQ